jgi:cellulose biosynthesis protein BcsQ
MRLLRPLAEQYDFLILDCPPSISLVSENVFRATDGLIVPFIPTTLSLRTYEQLLGYLHDNGLDELVTLMPFFSMVDRRKNLHNQLIERLPARFPELLTSAIPYASDVERMGPKRGPIFTFAPASAPAIAYERLWEEVQGRLAG